MRSKWPIPSGYRRSIVHVAAAAAILALPAIASAQTSGSWTSNTDGSWSSALNWNPAVPGSGGLATFTQHPQQSAARFVTLDAPISVGSLVFDTAYDYLITPSGTSGLNLTGPGIIDVPRSHASTPLRYAGGCIISAPIAGSAGLTKTGPGNVTLSGTNTFSGTVTLTGGSLRTTLSDLVLGNPSNNVILNGGALQIANFDFTTGRHFTLGAAGGTLEMFANATFNNAITGTGTFNRSIGSTLFLTAANTYSGVTNNLAGTIVFSGFGSALNTPAINSAGALILDNTNGNLTNRLPSVPMTLHGSGLTLLGSSTNTTTETIGNVTISCGQTYFTVTPDPARSARLTMASLTRANKAVPLFYGTNLGDPVGNGVANIFVTAAPALVGGGGAAGSTNISIIPGAVGQRSSTPTPINESLVTYNASTGVRPLLTSEYATTLGVASPTDNVRLTAAAAPAAAQTVNAIVAAGGTLDGTGTVTITSGMFVNTGSLITHSGRINFGTAEEMLYTSGATTFSGAISGSGGLIKAGALDATLSGPNTYTGTTTIVAGGVRLSGDVLPNTPGAFGNSDAPIVLAPGTTAAGIYTNLDNLHLARDLIVRGSGTGRAVLGSTLNGSKRFILDGNITLERELTLQGNNVTGVPMTINGTISGSGRLADNISTTFAILNGNNTFSGGINIFEGGYFAGSDTAFGTGTIWISSQGRIGAFGAPRTIANPITVVSSGGLADVSIGATTNGCDQPITFTGVLDLGGGKQGANDGPSTISTASGVTATFMSTVRDGGIKYIGGGTLSLLGNNIYTGGTTINAAGTLITNRFAPGAVSVVFGKAQVSLKATPNDPSGTSVIPSLTITSGSVDLTNNSMVIDYTTPGTVVSDVRGHLMSGRLFTSAGTATTRLGYGDNAILGKTSFAGVSPDSTSVLIKYTYAGDADLDGDADGVDIGTWATTFTGELGGAGNMVWTQGDWDYDGDVDGVDAGLWAQAFTGELGGGALGDLVVNDPNIAPGAAAILRGMGITVVPEPAGLGLVAIGAACFVRRRVRLLRTCPCPGAGSAPRRRRCGGRG